MKLNPDLCLCGTCLILQEGLNLLMQTIHGPQSLYPLPMEQAIDLYDEKADGKLDYVEFATAEAKYPILMWPIFELQVRMQSYVLGLGFWNMMFSRIHPDMRQEHFTDLKESFTETIEGWVDCAFTCLKVIFPCIDRFKRKTAVAEEVRGAIDPLIMDCAPFV